MPPPMRFRRYLGPCQLSVRPELSYLLRFNIWKPRLIVGRKKVPVEQLLWTYEQEARVTARQNTLEASIVYLRQPLPSSNIINLLVDKPDVPWRMNFEGPLLKTTTKANFFTSTVWCFSSTTSAQRPSPQVVFIDPRYPRSQAAAEQTKKRKGDEKVSR
ncbi:hypothetical protein BDZ97DRAFT_1752396 [Flammula alnicola]|nr:hypothetical protein BDZ97DRAFT_1752396 [Flammula alnicola]